MRFAEFSSPCSAATSTSEHTIVRHAADSDVGEEKCDEKAGLVTLVVGLIAFFPGATAMVLVFIYANKLKADQRPVWDKWAKFLRGVVFMRESPATTVGLILNILGLVLIIFGISCVLQAPPVDPFESSLTYSDSFRNSSATEGLIAVKNPYEFTWFLKMMIRIPMDSHGF